MSDVTTPITDRRIGDEYTVTVEGKVHHFKVMPVLMRKGINDYGDTYTFDYEPYRGFRIRMNDQLVLYTVHDQNDNLIEAFGKFNSKRLVKEAIDCKLAENAPPKDGEQS